MGKGIGRSLRLLVGIGVVAVMNNATAGPISTYDALNDFDFTFTFSQGVTTGTLSATSNQTASGDGQVDPASLVEVIGGGPNEMSIFMHVFGSGTGSSEFSGSASMEIIGPATGAQYEIDVTRVTGLQTVSAFAVPPGTALAQASEQLDIPGATFIGSADSGLCPAGVFLCYDAVGTVTATLSGDVKGDAFTPTAPEPATLALLGLGLAGLGFSRRKKE